MNVQYRQTTRDILGIFFAKKHVFFLTLLGVILGAAALSFLSPPIYRTSAQLVVQPLNSKPLLFDEDSSRVNLFNEVNEQTLNTVIFLLKSPDVLRPVVIEHELADPHDEEEMLDAINALSGRIKAEPLTMSSIIEVTLSGNHPEKIVGLLNSIIASYIRYHIQVNQATEGRLEFFAAQVEYFRDLYIQLNDQLARLGTEHNIIDPLQQKDAALKLIKDLELSKTQLGVETANLRSRVMSFRNALNRLASNDRLVGLPAETLLAYPALVEMEKSLAQLLINRQRALADFLPSSKQASDAVGQYQNMKRQIRSHLEQIIGDLEGQIQANEDQSAQIHQKIIRVNNASVSLANEMLEVERLTHEQKIARDNYTLYSSKMEEARINDEKDRAQFANVKLASRPVPPISPWFPQRGKIMALSIPLALMLAFALSAASYALEQRLWTPTDLALHTDVPVIGSLNYIETNPQKVESETPRQALGFSFKTSDVSS